MIQVIDIVQVRDDFDNASNEFDRIYDEMYPDLSAFVKEWEVSLVDVENIVWHDQYVVYHDDRDEWHNLILRRVEVVEGEIKAIPVTKEEVETELYK